MLDDYGWYRDVFGGAASEEDYNRYSKRAEMRINILSGWKAESAMAGDDERVKTLLKFAHAAGIDGYRVTDGGRGTIQSETTDGYSVSYSQDSRSALKLIDGAILQYLQEAGMVATWI